MQEKPRLGLALSGGGIRGLAHIGVLQVLAEQGIQIDMISGTSAGAIAAAMYACGYTPVRMQALAQKLKMGDFVDVNITVADLFKQGFKWLYSGMFRFWSIFPTGLIKGDKIEKYFSSLWQQKTVRDTQIPLAITAVDLNSADTVFFVSPAVNRRAILNARYYHNTMLTDAVRASISIPGIFHPKQYRSMTLVDGAVKNNLPTDILRHMGADTVIAVDLGYDGQANYNIKTVGEVLIQSIEIMSREVTLLKAEPYADVIIRPQTADINLKDMKNALQCIGRGRLAALAQLEEIQAALKARPAAPLRKE